MGADGSRPRRGCELIAANAMGDSCVESTLHLETDTLDLAT
jgi:hypothetical protein